MTWSTSTNKSSAIKRSNKSGRAFIVESLVLFIFLVATLIVVSQLFFASINMSAQGRSLERACIIASNAAERFAANPTDPNLNATESDLSVRCDVTPQHMTGGTLYNASITVSDESGNVVYNIHTSRYVSEVS